MASGARCGGRARATVVAALLAALSVAWVGGAAPASAHAELVATTPAAGAVVAEPPAEVTLRFDDGVTVRSGGVVVADAAGHRVDSGDARLSGGGHVVVVDLEAGLAHGGYSVAWRVLSDDSHPVTGVFSFSVGTRAAAGPAPAPLPTPHAGRPAAVALGAARVVGYAGLALAAGALVTVLLLWPAGRGAADARRLVRAGVAALLVGTAAAYLLEGPYAAGLPLSQTLSGTALGTVGDSRYGHIVLARLYLVAALAVLAPLAMRGRRPGLDVASLGVGVLVAGTFAVAGHESRGSGAALSVVSDTVHVSAMAAWLGGVAVLLVCRRSLGDDARPVVGRFSALALWAVAALAVTGGYQAVRETGGLAALTSTGYGRLLLAKITGLLWIVGLGALARRHLRGDAIDGESFRSGLVAEVAAAVAVLVVASALAAAVPAKTAYDGRRVTHATRM